jgi:AraC family transcriptional activator FtrA
MLTADIMRLPNPLVVALAYDGLCTFEFGSTVEVFGIPRPEMGDDWYRFAVAAVDSGTMRAGGGFCFSTDGGLELLSQAGTIVVPGWRGIDSPVPPHAIASLQQAHARGARILSICSGVFVLAAAGLLDGRRATTHWRYTDTLAARYPSIRVVPDVLYVDDGEILTSAGSAAGLDLCLHVVRSDFGAEAANVVARRLVIPPHRDGGQAQYAPSAVPVRYESNRLGPLLDYIRANITFRHSNESMAERAGMSTRTFLRRFQAATGTTPTKWILAERLARARDLLESSDVAVETVAELTGFSSAALFRHHFRQQLSLSPAAYKKAFRTKK